MVKIALTSPSAASKLVCSVECKVSVLTSLLLLTLQAAYQQLTTSASHIIYNVSKKYSSAQLNDIWKCGE